MGEAKRPKKVSKSASKIQITGEKVNLRQICRKFTTAARRGLRVKIGSVLYIYINSIIYSYSYLIYFTIAIIVVLFTSSYIVTIYAIEQ